MTQNGLASVDCTRPSNYVKSNLLMKVVVWQQISDWKRDIYLVEKLDSAFMLYCSSILTHSILLQIFFIDDRHIRSLCSVTMPKYPNPHNTYPPHLAPAHGHYNYCPEAYHAIKSQGLIYRLLCTLPPSLRVPVGTAGVLAGGVGLFFAVSPSQSMKHVSTLSPEWRRATAERIKKEQREITKLRTYFAFLLSPSSALIQLGFLLLNSFRRTIAGINFIGILVTMVDAPFRFGSAAIEKFSYLAW